MKNRFRLIRRGERDQFYCVDNETGHRTSLKTSDRDAAEQIVLAKNQALRQPALNLQIAKAYLAGTDNGVNTRTWLNAIESLTSTKLDANKDRFPSPNTRATSSTPLPSNDRPKGRIPSVSKMLSCHCCRPRQTDNTLREIFRP
jgi:hypothetical protein